MKPEEGCGCRHAETQRESANHTILVDCAQQKGLMGRSTLRCQVLHLAMVKQSHHYFMPQGHHATRSTPPVGLTCMQALSTMTSSYLISEYFSEQHEAGQRGGTNGTKALCHVTVAVARSLKLLGKCTRATLGQLHSG
jgi:hypothetical protein